MNWLKRIEWFLMILATKGTWTIACSRLYHIRWIRSHGIKPYALLILEYLGWFLYVFITSFDSRLDLLQKSHCSLHCEGCEGDEHHSEIVRHLRGEDQWPRPDVQNTEVYPDEDRRIVKKCLFQVASRSWWLIGTFDQVYDINNGWYMFVSWLVLLVRHGQWWGVHNTAMRSWSGELPGYASDLPELCRALWARARSWGDTEKAQTSAVWTRVGGAERCRKSLRIADVLAKMAASSDNVKRKDEKRAAEDIICNSDTHVQ